MKKILPLLLFLLAANFVLAQQPPGSCPGNMAPLASFCAEACVLCDIDGYIGQNVNQPVWEAPSTFCAPQFHSIQWIGFIAGTSSITFNITTLSCLTGSGLQAEIYRTVDCATWTSVSNCDPGFTSTTLTASGLTPGNTYFFVIDGNAADECEFVIDVVSGSATAPDVLGTPTIDGPTNICTGGQSAYTANGVTGAASYTWTLNGTVIGYDQTVPVGPLPTGSYELCVQPANPCFGDGESACRTINVGPLPPEVVNQTICTQDLPFTYQGMSFSASGTYNFSYFRPDGCEQPVVVNLNVIPPIPPTEIQVDICFGEAYSFGGNIYNQTGYYSHVFPSYNGCDSLVNLTLISHSPTFTQLGYIYHCQALGPYYLGGQQVTSSGDFSLTLTDQYGCDSVVAGYIELTTPLGAAIDTTICQGEFVEIGSFIYTNTGNYAESYTEPGGCQSNFNLSLTVYDPDTTINATICPGDTFTAGNRDFSATGTYTEVLPAQYLDLGCDSTITLNLTVLDPIVTNLNAAICEGESYTLGASTYTTSGTYTEVFPAANGCDSTVNVNLTVYPAVETTIDTSICFAAAYSVSDSTFTQSGNYEVLLQSAQGCDSTVFLNLTVKDAIITTLDEAVCDGDSTSVGGVFFSVEGTQEVVLTAADGCDSTVVLNLEVLDHSETTLDEVICFGESFPVGSSSYDEEGAYTDVLVAANGCDSTVTLNLEVVGPIINDITRRICTGQTYTVGSNSTYDTPGNYIDTLINVIGCDSVVNLTLIIQDVIRDTLVTSICEGESYLVDGTPYTTNGFYDNDFVTASGCDSVFYLDLTVIPTRITGLQEIICDGESVAVGSSTYTTTGTYQDLLTSVETGCDSIVNLDLQVLNVPRTSLTENICDGETYTVGASDYITSGTFIDTLLAANGCDSIVTLNLTVLDVPETSLVEEICDGETYTVGASDYTVTGTFTDTLLAANGCDSIVYLDLTVKEVPETFLVEEICQYDTYTVGSSDYTTSGSYTDILQAANGCDSFVYLELTVHPELSRFLDVSICTGSSYSVGGTPYNQAGIYVDTLSSVVTGCDSIVTLDLEITEFYEINLVEEICEFESYTVGTTDYTETGAYTQMFTSTDGCDSFVNLNLTVIPLPRITLDETICDGESVMVGGIDYNLTGTFTDTLTSQVSGCDSIVTLNLTVNDVFTTSLVEEICDGEIYEVGDSDYTTSGVYQDLITASNGCDSTVNLDLTVHPIQETNLVETICFGNTYGVGSSTYNSSGIYQDIIPSVVTGCDSIVNLDLTVREEITTQLEEILCYGDDFSVGMSTYDASGAYSDTLVSAATGCDSIVFLDLTVREEITTSLEQEICDGETYAVGSSDYVVSGNFVDTLTSLATGCDSIVSLGLTVHPIPMTALTEEICDGEVYEVGDSDYTASGTYQNVLTSVVTGCDSIVDLDLTVHPIQETNLVETICFGDTYGVGSSTYNNSGIYQDIIPSVVTGCDSIINLDLTVREEITTQLEEIVCYGDDFSVGMSTYGASGAYSDTLVSAATGCDSIVFLDLTVREEITTSLEQEICDGETYTVGSSDYVVSGNFVDTLTSLATGCDSIVSLGLTVHPIPMTALTEEICDGEVYEVGDSDYTASGTYQDVLTSVVTGCDSIVDLDLTVHPIPVTGLTEVVCFGGSVTVGNNTYEATGTYQDVLSSVVTGCDSIVNLDLTVRDEIRTGLEQEICDGEDYTVGTSDYTTSGIYIDTLSSLATGCDSIVTLDLTVHPIPVTGLVEEICDGEMYEVGDSDYTTSGTYQDILSSVVTGCDSIVNLDLTVYPIPVTGLVEEICDGEMYEVGDSDYTTSGIYQDILSSVVTGCDSIVNLDLTVHPIPVTGLVEEICDGEMYEVGDSDYTTSGTYQDILSSVVTGCDSIVNLDLTVHPIPVTGLVEEICDGETYEVGSSDYTATGIYQDILVSEVTGCDSIVNLDLTVNEVYDVELSENICTQGSFEVGGNSFSEEGIYTQTLSSQEGCDSVVTLNLFVYPCELVYDRIITNVSCNGVSDGNFSFQLTVGTPPYQYTWQSLSGTGDSGSGTLDGNNLQAFVDSLPAGSYRIDVVDSSPFNVEASFTVNITQPDVVDIDMDMSDYNNYNTSCHEEEDGWIDATVRGGTPPYSYLWSNGDRNEDIEGLGAGSYGLTVTDQNLCPDSARTNLEEPPPLEARLAVTDPPCFGDELGVIRVNDVNGGVSPYLYGIDEDPLSTVAQFTGLPIGDHMVQVQDANGCMWEEEERINQPEQLLVDLSMLGVMDESEGINLGDSVQLFAQTTYPVENYYWNSPIELYNCENCRDPFVMPLESMSFSVTAVDANGCEASDRITVFVDKRRDVYIPNVFSPNGDGKNDVFLIFAGNDAVEVKSFYVFNRWGEPMFELFDFKPNNPDYGWDGTHRGELMNGGVFVYMAEIEFVDGVTEVFKGDVLLMR